MVKVGADQSDHGPDSRLWSGRSNRSRNGAKLPSKGGKDMAAVVVTAEGCSDRADNGAVTAGTWQPSRSLPGGGVRADHGGDEAPVLVTAGGRGAPCDGCPAHESLLTGREKRGGAAGALRAKVNVHGWGMGGGFFLLKMPVPFKFVFA